MNYTTHTQKRCLERFNISLTDEEYKELCELTKNKPFIKESKHIHKTIIEYKGRLMCCIYSNRKHTIITVFPPKNKMKQELCGLIMEEKQK